MKTKVIVLISGRGSNMAALLKADQGDYEVVKVIADRPAKGLETAQAQGLATVLLDRTARDFQARLLAELEGADLVVLAGFLSILSKAIIQAFPNRIVNIHPSLLPKFGGRGMYGLKVHEAVLKAGETESGCTVHLVEEGVDTGKILRQHKVEVKPGDSAQDLQARIIVEEHACLVAAVRDLAREITQKKGRKMKKTALLSVFNKDGILDLAAFLSDRDFRLVSSGGTYRHLKENGFEVLAVEEVTGAKEILNGRVKTLHPKIHGGILARREVEDHMATLMEEAIDPIDLVCVNLYPFEEKLKENLSFADMIEFIDIGGPSMLRSAAKNFRDVFVLSDPSQYGEFMEKYAQGQDLLAYRQELARQVFLKTSHYDGQIQGWLEKQNDDKVLFPERLELKLTKRADLKYGENSHQKSAFYAIDGTDGFMTSFEQVKGKAMGYINYKDVEAAWRIAMDFTEPACAAVKHNTPCGVALGKDLLEAYSKAHEGDPVSIFGGIVAVNGPIDEALAEKMNETMLHIVVAPDFSPEALTVFHQKKNLILIKMNQAPQGNLAMVSCEGGLLIQEEDRVLYENLEIVTETAPSEEDLAELIFAMQVVKFVKSNAIVVTKDRMTTGIGGGFVNRVDAAKLALSTARGAHCLASDAFFPFSDTVEAAAQAGIKAIIQPGGSVKDQDSIDACNRLGIAMVFTGHRHFRH